MKGSSASVPPLRESARWFVKQMEYIGEMAVGLDQSLRHEPGPARALSARSQRPGVDVGEKDLGAGQRSQQASCA